MLYFPKVWELEMFQTAKVTFKVTQGYCYLSHSNKTWFPISRSL